MRLMKSLILPRLLKVGRYILACKMDGMVEKPPTMSIDEAYEVLNLAKGVEGSLLENSTRPLVFTSVSGCRASEYFDISTEN